MSETEQPNIEVLMEELEALKGEHERLAKEHENTLNDLKSARELNNKYFLNMVNKKSTSEPEPEEEEEEKYTELDILKELGKL